MRGISFTGSTKTGNRIIRCGGLKKYSMELGGKSPFIVFDDADFDRALDAALMTIYGNNGESCTAGSRILVQDGIYERFVARFVERTNRVKVGDPLDPSVEVGALITREHWEKVNGYIELGQQEGAKLVAGGGRPEGLPSHLANGNFIRRDLRQPFGGIKASGTGREGGIYSYEAFLEVKNVCVSMGSHHIPHWGK